jgi:flagellar biosynthetic protein FliQ
VTVEFAVEIYRETLTTATLVAAPILLTALLVGIAISLIQTLTSLQEQTLSFVPKAAAVALVVGVGLPWFLAQLMRFLSLILTLAPTVAARAGG